MRCISSLLATGGSDDGFLQAQEQENGRLQCVPRTGLGFSQETVIAKVASRTLCTATTVEQHLSAPVSTGQFIMKSRKPDRRTLGKLPDRVPLVIGLLLSVARLGLTSKAIPLLGLFRPEYNHSTSVV